MDGYVEYKFAGGIVNPTGYHDVFSVDGNGVQVQVPVEAIDCNVNPYPATYEITFMAPDVPMGYGIVFIMNPTYPLLQGLYMECNLLSTSVGVTLCIFSSPNGTLGWSGQATVPAGSDCTAWLAVAGGGGASPSSTGGTVKVDGNSVNVSISMTLTGSNCPG